MSVRIVIAGGGTGGHLFPGVAIAEECLARDGAADILFVGTERGIESRVLPGLGWALETITVSGLATVGTLGALRGLGRIPGALVQSRRILKRFVPDVVLGVGGYASGPLVLAAKMMGIPTAILEQNSIPGMTNRILGKVVDRVFLSFAHSQEYFAAGKSALVGNPIRKQILANLQAHKTASAAVRGDRLRLFIFGGSQGAVAVNRMCCHALVQLQKAGLRLDVVHQTGTSGLVEAKELYAEAGLVVDCRAFIDDMAAEYRAADIIVARAGATTIAELGIVGCPAILIPYPHAANNHQELNAKEMVDAGAAQMLDQAGNEDGAVLAAMIGTLLNTPQTRGKMSAAMIGFGRSDAAKMVVDWLLRESS